MLQLGNHAPLYRWGKEDTSEVQQFSIGQRDCDFPYSQHITKSFVLHVDALISGFYLLEFYKFGLASRYVSSRVRIDPPIAIYCGHHHQLHYHFIEVLGLVVRLWAMTYEFILEETHLLTKIGYKINFPKFEYELLFRIETPHGLR